MFKEEDVLGRISSTGMTFVELIECETNRILL